MDIGVLKRTAMEREVIEEDTCTVQTSNGTLYYWKFSSPKRLSAKTKTELKLEVDDSFNYYGSIDNDLFFVSEGKMHKSMFSESDGISLTYVRDKLENEQWFEGCLGSIEREGKQYVYKMCDDPIKEAILVDANLEDWEGITLIGLNRGTIIYRKVSPCSAPVVKRIGNNTLVILWKKDNVTVSSCPTNPCVYFSATGDARLYTLDTETLEFLPPVQIEGVSCISHISGVRDDVVTVNDKCLRVSAKLPKTFMDQLDYVDGPEFNYGNFYYDVKLKRFKEWLAAARSFQRKYAIETGDSGFFEFTPDERHKLTELIRIKLFGIRGENGYSKDETKEAINLKKKVIEVAGGIKGYSKDETREAIELEKNVLIKTTFLSTFTYVGEEKENQFAVEEIPVFIVERADETLCFVDRMGNEAESVPKILAIIGQSFRGGILYPTDLNHNINMETGKVSLLYMESAGSSLLSRTMDAAETILTALSIAAGVASFAIVPLASYVLAAKITKDVIFYASIASTALAVAKTSIELGRCHQTGNGEEAGGKVVFLFAMLLSTASQGISMAARAKIAATMQVKEGMFGGWFKSVFYTLRISATLTTFASITHSLYALYKEKAWTMADCYRLSMSIFALHNVVMSPWTVEAILASEQMRAIEVIETEIKMNEIPGILKELYDEGKVFAHKGAPVIRKLIEITDREHFVQLTSSVVRNEHSEEEQVDKNFNSIAVSDRTMKSVNKEAPDLDEREINEKFYDLFNVEDISSVKIADRPLFANMKAITRFRIAHMLRKADSDIIRRSLTICEDNNIRKFLHTPYDFACIVEILRMGIKSDVNYLSDRISQMRITWISPICMTFYYLTCVKAVNGARNISPEKFCDDISDSVNDSEKESHAPYQVILPRRAYYSILREDLAINV